MTDVMRVFASCVRGALVPAEGKVLQSFDFAGIESRVNAWLFNEEWKLKAFREYDAGTGPDLYCVTYGRAFRVDPRTIGKSDPRRQSGKVHDLAFGYEGGVSALMEWAKLYGMDLEEMALQARQVLSEDIVESAEWMWERFGADTGLPHDVYIGCDGVKQLWRGLHPRIKQGWKDLKEAAAMAVQNPGVVHRLSAGRLAFKVEGDWLYMRLPSGRKVAYFKPEYDNENVSYMGVDTKTRRWMRTKTYGGKLCENAVQATARDLLVEAMFNLEAAGYPTIGTVHDEILSEIEPGFGSLDEAREIMCRLPAWAAGLPVAAEGWRGKRYRK